MVVKDSEHSSDEELLTLEELTERVALPARTVRFYTSQRLVTPPLRRGRRGYYTPEHVARFELISQLQDHGFTLSAIKGYLDAIPPDAGPEEIALRLTMLAPWQSDLPETMTYAELRRRADRVLTSADLATLAALGIVSPVDADHARVAVAQLRVGLGLLDLGLPTEAARRTAAIYEAHGHALAEELHEVFRTEIWPAYKSSGVRPDQLRDVVERLKPLSIASLVRAYEAAMDATRRELVERRAQSPN